MSRRRTQTQRHAGEGTPRNGEGSLRELAAVGSPSPPTGSLRRSSQGPPDAPFWADAFDWYTFRCVACGEETYVGREPAQTVEDFALVCDWLYGVLPVCTSCKLAA